MANTRISGCRISSAKWSSVVHRETAYLRSIFSAGANGSISGCVSLAERAKRATIILYLMLCGVKQY